MKEYLLLLPKTKDSVRTITVDDETMDLLKTHDFQQKRSGWPVGHLSMMGNFFSRTMLNSSTLKVMTSKSLLPLLSKGRRDFDIEEF